MDERSAPVSGSFTGACQVALLEEIRGWEPLQDAFLLSTGVYWIV